MTPTSLTLTFVLACLAAPLCAQQQNALSHAQSVDACNGKRVLQARYLEDGRLGVRCARGPIARSGQSGQPQPPGPAGPTNFVPLAGALAPALGGAAALAAIGGSGSSTSSTSGTD